MKEEILFFFFRLFFGKAYIDLTISPAVRKVQFT